MILEMVGNYQKKARFSANSGQFIAPFPASVGSYNDIISSVSVIILQFMQAPILRHLLLEHTCLCTCLILN